MKERVQKLMAQANIASRRDSEAIIQQGRVRVNGRVIKLGDQADPYTDIIEVDGQKLDFPDRHLYIALNKPRNVLSTDEPHRGDPRKTVRDFVPHEGHLFSVGRLDADSEGLVVLTNDGDLANRLTHPRYRHTKTYRVVVYGLPPEAVMNRWQKGIELEDEETGEIYRTAPCVVQIVSGGNETVLRIIMTEGKKRQIRRVASALGYPVKSLMRTHIGMLSLGNLRPGEWRELTPQEVAALRKPSPEFANPRAQPPRPRSSASRPTTKTRRPSKSQGARPSSRPTRHSLRRRKA